MSDKNDRVVGWYTYVHVDVEGTLIIKICYHADGSGGGVGVADVVVPEVLNGFFVGFQLLSHSKDEMCLAGVFSNTFSTLLVRKPRVLSLWHLHSSRTNFQMVRCIHCCHDRWPTINPEQLRSA